MLYSTPTSRIYGLDLLVDTEPDGSGAPTGRDRDIRLIDPSRVVIRAAGVSTVDGEEYYEGDEHRILRILDQRFAVLPTGVISTWQGSMLDLPFLGARARVHGLELGLRLMAERRRPLPGRTISTGSAAAAAGPVGAAHPVCAAWHDQRHLDLCRVYRQRSVRGGVGAGAGESLGLDPARGAHLARSLAERRWFRARRFVDRLPPARPLTSYTWTCMSPDYADGPAVSVLSS